MLENKDFTDLLGTPFTKMQCWELVQEVYKRNHISLPGYKEILCIADGYRGFITEKEPQEGDICVYDLSGHGVDHAAVYLGNNMIIHATVPNGVCIERFSRYRPRLKGVYRYGNTRH